MDIVEIPIERASEIESLWCELNRHHLEHSEHFKNHFSAFSFSERIKALLKSDRLVIFAAKEGDELAGYCIASSTQGVGEVDSLYVKTEYRGVFLGRRLTEKALLWLRHQNCRQISVSVAEGNEEAIPFYEQFGFKRRFQVLQIKCTDNEVPGNES